MPSSTSHQKFCFCHLSNRGRAGIKLGDAWYVSDVSIIFDCSMLYYILFWTLLGFIIHFYIIFGTNILTGGPAQIAVFAYFSVSQKGIPNGIQTEWNLRDDLSWTKSKPGDLEWKSGTPWGSHEIGGRALGGRRALPLWAPCCSTDVLLPPIYNYVPPNYQIRSQNTVTFCIHKIPSWGLFRSSAGGGINRGGLLHQHPCIASPMMCE